MIEIATEEDFQKALEDLDNLENGDWDGLSEVMSRFVPELGGKYVAEGVGLSAEDLHSLVGLLRPREGTTVSFVWVKNDGDSE